MMLPMLTSARGMDMRSVVFLALCTLGVLLIPLNAAAQGGGGHPAVTPYVGSVQARRDEDGFRPYKLVTAVNPAGKTDEEYLQALTVEGKVTRLAYENPRNRSAHEIFTNYREGLEKGGFQIVFACVQTECGSGGRGGSVWSRVTGLRYYGSDQRYLVAKASKDGQDIYAAILVAKLRHQVEVVEVKPMEKGLVTAKALGDGLMLEGRAVLDGILFDTDKATIKAESKPALEAIAQFLSSNSGLNVFIVGHTDATGSFDHNMGLSKNRAASVVAALAKDYGIAAARLVAHGVGPLSPRKSNENDAGQAENRRVEMVRR